MERFLKLTRHAELWQKLGTGYLYSVFWVAPLGFASLVFLSGAFGWNAKAVLINGFLIYCAPFVLVGGLMAYGVLAGLVWHFWLFLGQTFRGKE